MNPVMYMEEKPAAMQGDIRHSYLRLGIRI